MRWLHVRGSGKPPLAMIANSSTSIQRLEFPRPRDPERIGLPVQVERRDRGELHAFVEDGIGRAGEDLYLVTELDQRLGEVAGVDALAARIRIPAINQEGDAKGPGHGTRKATWSS